MGFRLELGLFLVVLFTVGISEAKWVEGHLRNEKTNWEFLGRFCFLSKKGSLHYQFLYPVKYATEKILLYYDEPHQWAAVYKTGLSCEEKLSRLSPQNHQIIALNMSYTLTSRYSGCQNTTRDGEIWYNCTGTRTFRSMRQRWWFVAVARCEHVPNAKGLDIKYSMHMTNGDPGDILHYEFSADEFYILPIVITFFLAYIIIVILSVICAVVLRSRQLFHTTYKMYMAAIALWTFNLFLLCIAYGKYSNTGRSERGTIVTARVFASAANLIFLLMLILMAKGYTITRGRLSHWGSIKITVFTCLYIVVYAALLIWEANFFDPGLVLYIYESPPGYGLIAMRLIGWVWFLYAIFFTLKHHPKKGMFYYPLFIFYTLWFWAGPIVILIAMHALSLWTREKTVSGVENFVSFVGHIFFLILTRPSAANKNFPYHVRTSQIGILGDDSEGEVSEFPVESTGGFNPYPYASSSGVSFSGTGPDFTGLFIVSHTHSTERTMEKKPGGPDEPGYTNTVLPPVGGSIASGSQSNGSVPAMNGGCSLNGHLPPLSGHLPPLNGHLPPLQGERNNEALGPTAPPSYEALFQVGGNKSSSSKD